MIFFFGLLFPRTVSWSKVCSLTGAHTWRIYRDIGRTRFTRSATVLPAGFMAIAAEIKRKLFHHLSLVYMARSIWCSPRWATLTLLTLILCFGKGRLNSCAVCAVSPSCRTSCCSEILAAFTAPRKLCLRPSGIFWTLLGCWATILIFPDRRIVLPALGFLAIGDTAAALGGQKWGRETWKWNPTKTKIGSAIVLVVAFFVWAACFVRWPVALFSSVAAAGIESYPLPYNDNFWIPTLGGLLLEHLWATYS